MSVNVNNINLPDGAVLLCAKRANAQQPWIVLCHLPDNKITPYVTWVTDSDGPYWGEYYNTEAAAEKSFATR